MKPTPVIGFIVLSHFYYSIFEALQPFFFSLI